jgi:hypothetical protein
MANILISTNDKYPFFDFGSDKFADSPCDVPDKTIIVWKKVMDEFARVQMEMKRYVDPVPLDPNNPTNTTVDGTKG